MNTNKPKLHLLIENRDGEDCYKYKHKHKYKNIIINISFWNEKEEQLTNIGLMSLFRVISQ